MKYREYIIRICYIIANAYTIGYIYISEFREYMEDSDIAIRAGDILKLFIERGECRIYYSIGNGAGARAFMTSSLDPSDISSRLKAYRKIRNDILLEEKQERYKSQ